MIRYNTKKSRRQFPLPLCILLCAVVLQSCGDEIIPGEKTKPSECEYLFGGNEASYDYFYEIPADGGSISLPPGKEPDSKALYIPRFAINRSLQWIAASGYDKYTLDKDRCAMLQNSYYEPTWHEATFYYFVDGYAGKTQAQHPWEQDIKLFLDRTNYQYGSMEWASFEFHKGECIVTLSPNDTGQDRYLSLIYDNVLSLECSYAFYGAVEVKQPAQK